MIKNLLPIILKVVTYFVDTLITDTAERAKAHKAFNDFLATLEDAGLKSVRLRESVKSQRDRLKKRLGEL